MIGFLSSHWPIVYALTLVVVVLSFAVVSVMRERRWHRVNAVRRRHIRATHLTPEQRLQAVRDELDAAIENRRNP